MYEYENLTYDECCEKVEQIDEIHAKILMLQSQRRDLMRNPIVAAYLKLRDKTSSFERAVLSRMMQSLQ